jgi:hypothetical protein
MCSLIVSLKAIPLPAYKSIFNSRAIFSRYKPRCARAGQLYCALHTIFLHWRRQIAARAPAQKMLLHRMLQITAHNAGAKQHSHITMHLTRSNIQINHQPNDLP